MPASQTCLDPEVLAAFLDGALSAPAREEVMAHLVRCDACYEVYAGAVAFQLEEAEAGQEAHKVEAVTTRPILEAERSQETQCVEAAQTDPAEEAGLTRTPFWRADASRPSSAPGPPAGSRSARPVRTEPTPAAPTRDWDPAALSDLLQVIAAEPWPGDLGEQSPRRRSAPSAPSAPSTWMRWGPAFAAALLVGLAGPLYFALRPPSLPYVLQARDVTSSFEPRLHGLKTLKGLESPDRISLGPGSMAPRTAARLGVLLARLRMALVAEDGPHASDIARGIVALSAGPPFSAGTAEVSEALKVYQDLELVRESGADPARFEAYRNQAAEAEVKLEGAVANPALLTLMDLGKWAESARVAADLGDASLLSSQLSAAFLRRVLEKPPPTLSQQDQEVLKELRRQIGRGQPDLPEIKKGLDKLIKSMTAPPPQAE